MAGASKPSSRRSASSTPDSPLSCERGATRCQRSNHCIYTAGVTGSICLRSPASVRLMDALQQPALAPFHIFVLEGFAGGPQIFRAGWCPASPTPAWLPRWPPAPSPAALPASAKLPGRAAPSIPARSCEPRRSKTIPLLPRGRPVGARRRPPATGGEDAASVPPPPEYRRPACSATVARPWAARRSKNTGQWSASSPD